MEEPTKAQIESKITDRCIHKKNPKRLQEKSCNPTDCPLTDEQLLNRMFCGPCNYSRPPKRSCQRNQTEGERK